MNNAQISEKIKRLAALLALLEENPFKIRAFEKAARIVKEHPEEMGILIDEDRLKHVKGIGETLAQHILYYAKSGSFAYEREIEAALPPGLPDLLEIPGLGVKKVHVLWKQHQIDNIDQLKQACLSNELSSWKGFGAKLEQQLLKGIAFKALHVKDFHLNVALQAAKIWKKKLRAIPSLKRFELTGQLRRGDTLIQSVDFLVEIDPTTLKSELISTLNLNPTGADPLLVMDTSGLPINLWLSDAHEFQTRQLILTAGSAYLNKIESSLDDLNLRQEQGRKIDFGGSAETEAEVCDQLGIQWIVPELRDAFDHFPAESTLIRPSDIKGVIHAHSSWSDGRNSLQELVEGAQRLGYQYLGISEHSQAAYYANGLQPERVRAQWERIDELNEQYPDFHIFKGIEADILSDGRLDYEENILAGFDFVIASIHSHFHLNQEQQTDRIVRALQSPFTTMLGHPTGRMLLGREGYCPNLPAIIDAAVEFEKIIEINSTPKRLDLDWKYLKNAREKGLKVSINPDAHGVEGMNSIPLGVTMARKGGLSPQDVINTMGVNEMARFLESRRS
ncbi:hypothetical protein HQ531_13080 [bacterium]|nr:hypothetical protein [bacterium]